jgi:hypothetical protein
MSTLRSTGAKHKAAVGAEEPLLIYEGGGGGGANAVRVLDLLAERAPDVYARTRYTLIQVRSAARLGCTAR